MSREEDKTSTTTTAATMTDSERVRLVSEFPDESTFKTSHTYPALIAPVKRVAELRRKLKDVMFRVPRIKPIYPAESDAERILVLANNEALSDSAVQAELESSSSSSSNGCRATEYTIELTYNDMTTDDVLRKILPFDEVPSAFEAVGHLAHLNLREECLPFKYWIGKVIFDKNQPRLRTVVNKLGNIENEFRTFGMEVIAGDDSEGWSKVSVKEEGCTFALDFREVYWNSRLAGEHKRLVAMLYKAAKKSPKPIIVADVMAGVGPFAVPLTAHKDHNVVVYANDLNPSSFKYLEINREKNKCKKLHCYNEDGRAFVHRLSQEGIKIDHAIMNLPAIAPEFLDAFQGFASGNPRIHVHCFAPKESEMTDYQCAVDRCSKALGHALDRKSDRVNVRVVRDVSPKKNMLCVSFQLSQDVCNMQPILLVQKDEEDLLKEPAAKRLKSED